jgi:hypothetical protein
MRRCLACLLMGAALASCGSQTDKELEAVKSARSVLAEWALVEERSAHGLTPSIYVEQMRDEARMELETAASELRGQPRAAMLIGQVRDGSADSRQLLNVSEALEPLERSLESA